MNTINGISINKKSNYTFKIAIIFISITVFISVLALFQNPVKNFFRSISSPAEKYLWGAGNDASEFLASLFNAKNIVKENENLRKENQSLLAEITSLQSFKNENNSLRAMASITNDGEYKLLMAAVIGLNSSEDIISINKGLDDGVLENMPIISSEKVVFGKVLKVYKNYSEVLLISNKNSVINVKIKNSDEAQSPIYGVARGNGNLGIYLDMIPVDSSINSGDVLVTSSLEGTFPKNLLVGKVNSINKNDLKPFQTIKIYPFFNINNTDDLFIVLDYKQK